MADTLPKIMPREKVKLGPRKQLTRAQVIEIAQRQSGNAILCGCGCGAPLRPKCVDEHGVPRDTLTPELADRIDNRHLYNTECAQRKTSTTDAAIIAKFRAIRGERGSQAAKRERRGGSSIKSAGKIVSRPFSGAERKIQGRPFSKGLRKRMSGTVERVET